MDVLVELDDPPVYVSVKLEPEVLSVSPVSDVLDRGTTARGDVHRVLACHAESSIGPVVPSIVAVAPVNVTVLKSANCRTPCPDDGASTIHSADERCAPDAPSAMLNDSPFVVSLIDNVNFCVEVE